MLFEVMLRTYQYDEEKEKEKEKGQQHIHKLIM